MACPAMLTGYAVYNFHKVIPTIIAPVPRILVRVREYLMLVLFVYCEYFHLYGGRYVKLRG